jgi:pyroglutamyl-peptidase
VKKILVAGFEPFDGDSINPSAVFLSWLDSLNLDFKMRTELLPVSFKNAYPKLEKAILEFNPTHVILTGFAKNRTELTLERIGINWVDARIPDNDGLILKAQKIKDESEDALFTSLPIEKMLEAAKKVGCPTKISTSAGEYVCNYLTYLFLFHHKLVPGTFIHIPAANDHNIFFRGILNILSQLE